MSDKCTWDNAADVEQLSMDRLSVGILEAGSFSSDGDTRF